MTDECTETESTAECEGAGGESEKPVDQSKNGTVNRWTMIVAGALLLLAGGGSGSALSLLSDRANNNDCRDMVLRLELSDDQMKALRPRQSDENLATKIETALLDQQIKTLREQVSELREERRPGRRQLPD